MGEEAVIASSFLGFAEGRRRSDIAAPQFKLPHIGALQLLY